MTETLPRTADAGTPAAAPATGAGTGERWSPSAVAIDLAYHDAAGNQASPPPNTAIALLAMAESGLLPGSLFRPTPQGARVVFAIGERLEDPETFDAIAREAGRRTAAALGAMGILPGYKVDGVILTDHAEALRPPGANTDGTPGPVTVLREEPFTVAALLPAEPDSDSAPAYERPVLRVTGGNLSELATEAERALIAAGVPIYCRAGILVRPVEEDVDAAHGRRTRVARLVKVDPAWMRDALCKAAAFERFDRRSNDWRRIDPPLDVVQTILARDGEWEFPVILGVITTPTLRADGTPLTEPGYDPATRLLLVAPPAMPPIPDAPTREEANRALYLLLELLAEFPFVDEASRSVALSMLLTPIARGAFTVAPAHAASASTPGTGKSFLADLTAAICMGQRCPAMAAGRDEAETEKRLSAALIAGQQLIALDNVNGELGGDALCQLIERPVVEVRILGKSERVRVESRATVLLNGNNLTLLGDMTRRVLLARLDAGVERPELRQFKGNPFAAVLADRGRYVAAALTILRAYIAAGRPDPAPRLASFEGWSDTVRSALLWLGCADPVDTMETARAEDPVLGQLRAVVSAWAETLGAGYQNAHTAAGLLGKAEECREFGGYRYPELREAVLSVGTLNGRPNARTLGRWLARNKGRIADGLRIAGGTDEHGHSGRWWVEPVAVIAVPAVIPIRSRESLKVSSYDSF